MDQYLNESKGLKLKNLNKENENENERKHSDSYSSIFKTKTIQKKNRKKLQNSSVTSINSFTQTTPISFRPEETQSIIIENAETPVPEIKIDYENLIPNQHGDLSKLNYTNDLEKYLITRMYSNVNKLSTIISEMDAIDLDFYLKTPDQNECLPLYYAIKAQCINTIKLLLLKGSSLNQTTKSGDPAVHLACLLGSPIELIEFLLSKSDDLYKTDQEGWCVLHCACNQGHIDIVKYLVEKKFMNPNVKDAKKSYTGIQLAAMNGRLNIVEYLLSFQSLAGIKKPDKKDTLPDLNKNLKDKSKKLSIILEEEPVKRIKKQERITLEPKFLYSIDNKLDVQPKFMYNNFLIDLKSQNNEGHNILHLACMYGHYDIVNLLLKKYASNQIDVNVIDFKGKTCLDLAWIYSINLESSDEKSIFYDSQNSFYVQRRDVLNTDRIEREIKLIFLLTSYGAKFSDIKQVLYNLDSLQSISNPTSEILFLDEQNMIESLKDPGENFVSIKCYLKCLLHLFKLNLPTLFLNGSKSSNVTESSDSNKTVESFGKYTDKNEFIENLSCLKSFIEINVIDPFEKQVYLNDIDNAEQMLSKF